jgi:hypothetical protein
MFSVGDTFRDMSNPTPATEYLTALFDAADAVVNELGLYADAAERGEHLARTHAFKVWKRATVAVSEVCRWATDDDAARVAEIRAGLHACEAVLRLGSAAPAPLARRVA